MKAKFGFFLLLVFLVGMLSSCGLSVPRPEVKSGEFDFSVTYEFNGEIKTVSGVYVCEYDGTERGLYGCFRSWKGYIKDYEVKDKLEIGTTDDGGTILLITGLYPEYFMGDDTAGYDGAPTMKLMICYPENEHGETKVESDMQVIEEDYGARIVNYEYDEPIQNSFGLFK